MCLPVESNSEEEESLGRRRRESSHGAPLIDGVYSFSGDVDCCAGFVSAQEVRASERASRARPRMREICFFL